MKAGSGTKSYDVVPRNPRFDLANVSHIHHDPAGDPGAAGSLAVLRQMSLVSFNESHACAAAGVQGSPAAARVLRVVMKVHLLSQFRMILKEKGCV